VRSNPASRIIYLATVLFALYPVSLKAQKNVCSEALMLVKTAEKYHYQPRAVDNDFSELVFDNFISLLDPFGLYLSETDMADLEESRASIDDDLLNQRSSFLTKATDLYGNNLLRIDSLLTNLETSVLDFNADDSIVFYTGRVLQNGARLQKQWEKLIKLQVLNMYFSAADTAETSPEERVKRLKELQETVIGREHCRIKTKLFSGGGLETYTGSLYLKAVAMAFDSHTLYFSKAEEQGFTGSLSKEARSFGFEVSVNEYGEIAIVAIIPGGPAWKSNELNIGDVILKVTSAGKEKDFACIGMQEAMDFMGSKDMEQAAFVIRKKSGEEIALSLQKELIDVQENVVQSFILEGKARTGYIYLPSFYAESDENYFSYKGCANDVAKELIRLKKEGIAGLILDLRNNGGGSMLEAVLLAGLFIDYGAVGISQTRGEEPLSIKDMNRGTIYSGPLLILINTFSASASELFAAAMQDYNRAVIVGSRSFGKSTMQQIVPLDAYKYASPESYKGVPAAYLNLTRGVFYRVTGKSLQKEGVIPDIILPSVYYTDQTGERYYEAALDTLSTDKKAYFYPLKDLPLQTLNELSKARRMNDPAFISPEKSGNKRFQRQGRYSAPLQFEAYRQYALSGEDPDLQKKEQDFRVKYPGYMEQINGLFASYDDRNTEILSHIKSDIIIGEAYSIMNDLLNLNKKTN